MKKIIVALLALMLVTCCALAEETNWFESEAPADWYELSAGNSVLTVRLPGNTKTGLTWSFEVSDSSALELITHETVIGESEGMAGTPITYVASFMASGSAENTASLILRCSDESNPGEAAAYTRVLELSTDAGNRITVNSVLEQEPFADWCEYGDGGYILTARMPDADWGFEITDPEILELITCDGSDGSFTASFMATMAKAGSAEIVFADGNGLRFRTVSAFVNESGAIDVNRVETFEILETPQPVYCEVCGGWYEAGNVFRNHICVSPTAEPREIPFRTVNVTGGSVNVREGAGTGNDVVMVLKKGTNARYLDKTASDSKGTDWHKVSYNGKTGWISSQYASLGGKGYVKITGGNCNMRGEPNLDGDVITVISKGAIITYLGQGSTDTRGSDWYKVKVNGKEGWVSSKYATFVASATEASKTDYKYAQVSGGSCNLRKSPDVDAKSLATLKEGTVLNYLGEKSTDDRGVAWYKVSYNKKTGWVSSKYIKLKKNNPAQPAKTPKPSESDDMRLVYNPNRYDVLKVTDIYSQNGRDYFVTGCFGKINKNGEPEKFDDRKSVTMPLVPGAEVMLPQEPNTVDNIDYVESPEIWFNEARNLCGGSYSFYATFSMNESGALRSLVYRIVY